MNKPAQKGTRPTGRQTSITLDKAKRRKIDRLAHAEGRSRSSYITQILDRHLEEVGRA